MKEVTLIYIRCPVCGSLRRWDKGGFSKEVKDFEFVVDVVKIGGRGVLSHNWKTVEVTNDAAYLILLENLLSRLRKAQKKVQDAIHRVRLALIGQSPEVKRELVDELDSRVPPDSDSVLTSRTFLATLNWRANSWLLSESRLCKSRLTTPLCVTGLTKTVILASGMSVLESSSIAKRVVLRSSSKVVAPARKR